MLDPPRILHTSPRLFAGLRLTIEKPEIQRVMGPGLAELKAALAAQGVAPAGPWFTHHFRIEAQRWDFEIGIPVPQPIRPAGRVQPGEWPAMQVARATHRGGYEGLAAAWGELDAWITERGLARGEALWEEYAVGPESSDDPGAWQTELTRPLATR